MPRASMAQLIAIVRLKTGFPSGGTPAFTDDQIQDVLDAHRCDVRYLLLMGMAAQASNLFNVSIDGRNMSLNQITATWEKLANFYFSQSWPTTIELQRSDVAAGEGSSSSLLGDKSDWTSGGLLPSAFGQGVTGREGG